MMPLPPVHMIILAQSAVTDANRFNGYLVLAYVAMWLIAMVYLLIMANRQRNARQELKLMRQLLEDDQRDQGT
jgi:hypothetical protein